MLPAGRLGICVQILQLFLVGRLCKLCPLFLVFIICVARLEARAWNVHLAQTPVVLEDEEQGVRRIPVIAAIRQQVAMGYYGRGSLGYL